MAKVHGWCPLHKIAYNRKLDATCPQCLIAGIIPPAQLDYDPDATVTREVSAGSPVDAAGKPVEA
jgi:hypothetical protein